MKRSILAMGALLLGLAGSVRGAGPPKQVTGLKALHRAGQTFLTFADPEDTFGPKPTWGQIRRYRCEVDPRRQVRYRVYRSDRPITAANIARATRLAEIGPLSGINVNSWSIEKLVNQIVFGNADRGELGKYGPFSQLGKASPEAGKLVMPRLAITDGKPLPPGVGLYVHSAGKAEAAWYAVTAVAGGVENVRDFGPGNSLAEPVREAPATWRPVEQPAGEPFGWDFRGTRHFYVTWAAPPLAPKPMHFNWSVLVPPDCKAPAPVELYFHAPGRSYARPPVKFFDKSIQIAPHDFPFSGWYGYNDALLTGGKAADGTVQPYTIRRIEAFLRWAGTKWPVDDKRVVAVGGDGAMMFALHRPKRLAYVVSMGFEGLQLDPKAVKDFQAAWGPQGPDIKDDQGRSRWTWGAPDVLLTGRRVPNNRDNKAPAPPTPSDAPGFAADLPLFACGGRSWGVDPGYARGRGRLYYALQGTLHPFYGRWGWRKADYPSKFTGLWYGLDITNDMPVPAITRCSGDVDSEADGNANGWITWKDVSETPKAFELTFFGPSKTTFDVTPRRLGKLKVAPGETLTWQSSPVEVRTWSKEAKPAPRSGQVQADEHGLVTVRGLTLPRGWGLKLRLAKADAGG